MKEVVGVVFLDNGKFLISKSVKSSKNNKYTLVGGGIEEGENIFQAAVRECKEEIQNGFDITENDFTTMIDFEEHAASDYNLMIHMHMLLSKIKVDVELKPNEEILEYRWFDINNDQMDVLSDSIAKHLIPYLKNKHLI